LSKFQVGERVRENIHGGMGTILEVWNKLYHIQLDNGRIVNFVEDNLEFVPEKVDFT
jgi:hypothetical protein